MTHLTYTSFLFMTQLIVSSCSKEKDEETLDGVWKVVSLVHKDCLDLSDNKEITFIDGCATENDYLGCWELRFKGSKMTSLATEKQLSTGNEEEYREEIFFKIVEDKFLYCDNEQFTNCDEWFDVEIKENILVLGFPDGYSIENCYSVATFVKQ